MSFHQGQRSPPPAHQSAPRESPESRAVRGCLPVIVSGQHGSLGVKGEKSLETDVKEISFLLARRGGRWRPSCQPGRKLSPGAEVDRPWTEANASPAEEETQN
ncbi:hypothetical protein RRG08_031172 [Elysia crispata]|uniref:Uncharacterized protein n=1 Tax=Elysia crispata TaxID=231223 RepID=A0AAE0ZFB9_9GAST|nr:hypothetical protein RRG08_031172 [Elysia crispata]